MRSYILTASALTAFANAQTFTLCNPMEKECDNNPAIAKNFESNFKDGESALKGWQQTAKGAEFTDEGVVFSVKKTGDAPTIQSDGYLHFGYVEVTMKAAKGAGIVSSIVLESDDLDEVDWEFIGSDLANAQMNYFGKGNTTVYDRMIMAPIASIEEVHRYALNWTSESLTWLIDDAPVRTLNYADANGGHNYPQTPCNVRIGIWAGGDSADQGTQDWAGGKVDYSQAPFNQVVEKVKITNYSPGKEYEWTDKSGSFESIKVIDGEGVSGGSSESTPSTTGKTSEEGAAATSTPCSEEATTSTPPPEETPCDCEVETVTVTGPPPTGETPPPEVPASSAPPPPTTETPPPEVPVTSDSPPPPESTPAESSSTSCTETVATPPPEVPVTSDSPPPPESTPVESTPVESGSASVPPPEETPCTTSEVPPPPPVETPTDNCTTLVSVTVPPYPITPTGGIIVETSPAPSVPYPTNPTGALPNPPNGTAPPEFTGGSSVSSTVSYVLALAAGIMVFAL